MQFHYSQYADRSGGSSGILELMQDLDTALNQGGDWIMLGGGNPAAISELEEAFRKEALQILQSGDVWHQARGVYAGPAGDLVFRQCVADYLNQRYRLALSENNIALTNGSQDAFFKLFNLFCGRHPNGEMRSLVLPRLPDYIGYTDTLIDREAMRGLAGIRSDLDDLEFEYKVDHAALAELESIGAICLSRPTNPTGQVLATQELEKVYEICRARSVPLIIDAAYGMPFPGLQYDDTSTFREDGVIWILSLSKLGLPGMRTGIVIAPESVIQRLRNLNAILCLAPGNIGPMLAQSLIKNQKLDQICQEQILPFYDSRRRFVLEYLKAANVPGLYVHRAEGAFFCWIQLRNLSIPIKEFYERLKQKRVLIVPGHYFYPGMETLPDEANYSLRLSYTRNPDVLERGLRILCDEARYYSQA